MTIEQIKQMVEEEEYDFLRTDPHLADRLMFLTLGGSYAYGTNLETSDVDIRGCAMNSKMDLLGLSNFEQVVHARTDTTIYGFNKLIQLLLNCNPNTIEMLGCKPEHYLLITDLGRSMIDNRKLFLSRRAAHSFGGYATQQLRRLENAIARDKLSQPHREDHILSSMQSTMNAFEKHYARFDSGSIKLYTDESEKCDIEREVYIDIHMDHYPARDFNGIINELTNVIRSYEKLGHRNNKKDDAHLGKHAMHLIRLYLMCLDILERGEIVTYREKEHELLMSIRGGSFQREDGTYRQEFFDMVNAYEARLSYARENTHLPDSPDMRQVEEFVMEVNRSSIDR